MHRIVQALLGFAMALHPCGAQFGASAMYPHLHPKHIALTCSECHSLKPDQADIHEMPGHANCTGCHNFAKETMERMEAFCGECHTAPDATKDTPALYPFPRPRNAREFSDQFSHVAHKKAGLAARCREAGTEGDSHCAECHPSNRAAVPGTRPDKRMEASHTFCFACHCETPRGYTETARNTNPSRNDCAVCHITQARALVTFADIANFRHADHVFDTRPRKKGTPLSRGPDVLCTECHKSAAESEHLWDIRQPQSSVCTSCHTGKLGLPDPLPATILQRLEAGS